MLSTHLYVLTFDITAVALEAGVQEQGFQSVERLVLDDNGVSMIRTDNS